MRKLKGYNISIHLDNISDKLGRYSKNLATIHPDYL